MADKSNPFRDVELREALERLRIRRWALWPNGASIDLYAWDHRWLALMVYQSRLSQRVPRPFWGLSTEIFLPLRALEVRYPAYRIVGLFQDQPNAGTLLTGQDIETLVGVCSEDRKGNVKLVAHDMRQGTYMAGADPMAAFILELLKECPADPNLGPPDLIPYRRRIARRRSRIAGLPLSPGCRDA